MKAVSRMLARDCEIVGTVADGSALLEPAQRLQPDVIVQYHVTRWMLPEGHPGSK